MSPLAGEAVAVDSRPRRSSYPRKRPEEGDMQYALLIYGSGEGWEQLSEDERQAQMGEYMALSERPETKGGAELDELESATTVRVDNGDTVTTDGPFAETKEYLGGFYLVDCANLDDAIAFAAKIPAARNGGAIEVRPVIEH
jgi:hypothetical protein